VPTGSATAPGPPKVDMLASGEMQAYLDRLKREDRQIGTRNVYLAVALGAGLLLLLIVLWVIYQKTVGAYAVIDEIQVEPDPIQQGRLRIRFRVLSPGKVYCRRTSGAMTTDRIDTFDEACDVDRSWSWGYRPGEPIELALTSRGGLFCKTFTASCPTHGQADIVILMDTTGSMTPSIQELKDKCVTFSEKLDSQDLTHRFALIGFGDTNEGPWVDVHGFTSDVNQFVGSIDGVKRFDGGDLPESALDALETALELPLAENAIRRFYLVTDAAYHGPTQSGATAETIRARLLEQRVLLTVFSKPRFQADYEKLLGAETGRFLEIENFGKVLSQGRVLED